jgi:outer membrane protein assembly factor BamA
VIAGLGLLVAFFLFALLALPRLAHADEIRGPAVVISVPPPSTPPPANPKLEPEADLSAFVGHPITAVEIALDDDTWTIPDLPKITTVRPGQTMDGAAARRALAEVLESGRFARARVVARADGAGVKLVVHVAQRRLIQTLRLDLHGTPIERDELLREADLADGGEVLGIEMDTYRQRMERYLARRGFPTATVSIQSRETDDPTRVTMLVNVLPGGARVLQRRVFYVVDPDGAPSPSLRVLKPVLDGYLVGVGARADETALDAADVAMAARLHALDYQSAALTHDLVFADDLVTLRVRVAIGPHFEPRFEGNARYDSVALAGALGLDEETDLTPAHLVQKLRDFYVKRGFLDVEVTLEPRGGPRDRIHLLVFHVVENHLVKVASRAYPCLKLDEAKKLTGGGPRSPSEIGSEIDSYLEEDLPGVDLVVDPNPRGLDATITAPPSARSATGTRVSPLDLDPDATFAPDTYDRAAAHVQELYRNEGYLHAEVGPVLVLRRQCDRRSPPGRCIPLALPAAPPDECTYDTSNLPLPVAPLDPSFTCTPDPARGVECEGRVTLRIPVKLGPRTVLYDLGFTGAHTIPETRLVKATDLTLGEPANTLKLEDARRKILELYKEEGYAYADVKYVLESSVDFTRARARFDVVEGDQVIVREILIRGNTRTNDGVIRRRIALDIGKPYRASGVRKTQERIATLNVFSNVGVALEEPYVPQKSKTVIVTVTERNPQSIEVSPGLSTGEGIRGEIDYTHANIGGDAIGLSLRVRLSYLPDFMIFDPVVKQNFDSLSTGFSGDRLARRLTATITLPEIGFGPLVRSTLDGVIVHDLEHDFVLDKDAGIPTIYYRPFRELQFSLAQTFEHNVVQIFGFASISSYLTNQTQQGNNVTDLRALLRFPDVPSDAFAQRFVVTWDRRDNAFNPHKGTFLVSGLEHTDWSGECAEATSPINNNPCTTVAGQANVGVPFGHTMRFTETFAFYVPVSKTITFAAELRTGLNVQLNSSSNSATYPDRLFFLGGFQSVRGYLQDSMITQEDANRIAAGAGPYARRYDKENAFTIADVALRGGNLMINPKLELRIPVFPPFDTVFFVDAGNIWQNPSDVFQTGFNLRTTAGTGIRLETPIGPVALDGGINLSRLFSSPEDPRRVYEDFGAINFAIGLF